MGSLNFNNVILGGRIANDFELKSTPSGISVTSSTVAVKRSYRGDVFKSFFTKQEE